MKILTVFVLLLLLVVTVLVPVALHTRNQQKPRKNRSRRLAKRGNNKDAKRVSSVTGPKPIPGADPKPSPPKIMSNTSFVATEKRMSDQTHTSDTEHSIDKDPLVSTDHLYIPVAFEKADSMLFSSSDWRRQPFPRWVERENENSNVTIMETLLDFMNESASAFANYLPVSHTKDHRRDIDMGAPETLFVLTNDGVYVSDSAKQLHIRTKRHFISRKFLLTHDLIKRSFDVLRNDRALGQNSQWPRLNQLLWVNNNTLPFIMWFGDYNGCAYHNWRGTQTVALFTVAAEVTCRHAFPFPNFETYADSLQSPEEWMQPPEEKNSTWKEKIPQVVWRGGLTGNMPSKKAFRGPRYHVTRLVHSPEVTSEEQGMFNVKLTRLPSNVHVDLGELGGMSAEHFMPMSNFREYRAVLDVDGHSWSSRFGKLLCYSSVVLKVDPRYVDYFHFKRDDDTGKPVLQPWKHYIPVKSDLSDLMDKAKYALADENAEHIEEIIKNANEWCQKSMIRDSLAHDVVDVWESYAKILDQHSPSWEEQWKEEQPTIMSGPLQMKLE